MTAEDRRATAKRSGERRRVVAAAHVERALAIAILLAIPVIAPWRNIELSGRWIGFLLLCAGVLVCWFLLARVVGPTGMWLLRSTDGVRLRTLLSVGIFAQVLVAIVTAPIPISDFEHYSYLARRLASGLPYVDEIGRRATWPPGLPFTLAPFVAVFGPTLTATLMMNVLLYLGAAAAIWTLASRLAGPRAAAVATLLFTLWPSRLLMAGLAAKENLLVAAVTIGIALGFQAFDPAARRPLILAFCAGIALGVAILAQPGVLPLLVAVPICYRFAIGDLGSHRYVARVALVVGGAAIIVTPWVVRNCAVFDGAFCGISTNGGSVFYRANNPNASGIYTSERGSPLEGLAEVDKNRRGYELGRQWIAAHPLDAAKLTMQKLVAYLGGDIHGAYWGVLRATGGDEEEAFRTASAARMVTYRLASGVSLVYWVLLAVFCAQALWRGPPAGSLVGDVLVPLFYPFLCGAAVYGIFESGDRQHMFAVGPLIVLAAVGIMPREAHRAAEGSILRT